MKFITIAGQNQSFNDASASCNIKGDHMDVIEWVAGATFTWILLFCVQIVITERRIK
jgi:hypothetical protein